MCHLDPENMDLRPVPSSAALFPPFLASLYLKQSSITSPSATHEISGRRAQQARAPLGKGGNSIYLVDAQMLWLLRNRKQIYNNATITKYSLESSSLAMSIIAKQCARMLLLVNALVHCLPHDVRALSPE